MPAYSKQSLREKFHNLSQKSLSVTAYIHAFQQLVLQIGDVSASEALHKFVFGLNTAIRDRVLETDVTTLAEAYKRATLFGNRQVEPSYTLRPVGDASPYREIFPSFLVSG